MRTHISHAVFPFAGRKPGGSHISSFTLAKTLNDVYNIKAIVVAPDGTQVVEEARRFGLSVQTDLNYPLVSAPALRDALFVPRRVNFLHSLGSNAIVHCNDIWNLRSWYIPALIARVPIVYHHRAFGNPNLINRIIIGRARQIISISDACSANLHAIVKRPVRRVTNPFITSEENGNNLRLEILDKLPQTKRPHLIGFVANFQSRKRPHFFVDVAAEISKQNPDTRFVMFGRGRDVTDIDLIAQAQRLGIADKLLLAGFRSPPEANIAALDCLVAPAFGEPFGRTLVEAILLRTPYVATDDAGHSEIYQRWKGGLLASPSTDPKVFADMCLDVLNRSDSICLSHAERHQVVEAVSPLQHARVILEVYKEALSS